MSLFLITNGAAPTTAAAVAVTTGTAIKTMLQVLPLRNLRVAEWGISFNASALATPIVVEFLETGTVFATVTAHVEGGITKLDDPNALAADFMTLGTASTGYTASAEGTITTSRPLAAPQFISVLSQPFVMQYALGNYPILVKNAAVRIRVTAPAAVNCYCYMILQS